MFQHIISQVLAGCEGVSNIADDIIVHRTDKADHDIKLRKCMETLMRRGLTVNKQKSQLSMSKITFKEHSLAGKGI